MKAWGEDQGRESPDAAAHEADGTERAETIEELEAAGIDLDPIPPGHHRHGAEVHASDHSLSLIHI